jgi:hypothetical protein
MTYFKSARSPLEVLLRVDNFSATFPAACWWAGRRAIASLDIDLEKDDCQEIVRKLERWEDLEARVRCPGARVTP